MKAFIRFSISALSLFLILGTAQGMAAQDPALQDKISALADGSYSDRAKAIQAIAATGDARAVPALEALGEGLLFVTKSDKAIVIGLDEGATVETFDPISGDALGAVPSGAVEKIKVNNRLRREIRSALGALTLLSDDPKVRMAAAGAIFKSKDADSIDLLDTAIAKETVEAVKLALQEARAAAVLNSTRDVAEKQAAVALMADRGNQSALAVLLNARGSAEGPLLADIDTAIAAIQKSLAVWDLAQNAWYGVSLGSVLLLAAIGLAITFGVMGVINMAHGEMVMLGAYTTFIVQDIIRTSMPGLFDYSLLIALPLAFLVAGSVGIIIERGVIRWLYGRPLETLLATWGIALLLQQTVRSIFGPTNREVGTPDFLAGAFQLGQLTITYNRLAIVIFSLVVLAVLMLVLRKTSFGLRMRAVTQNRRMANSMGIKTNWVDAMTFGLGSGIAGIAGVALSQIDNVSPNLGQSYIIDSFLVVVFGGVGNLWGTLVGAMTLGIANKFLEPFAGAVLGKIILLVCIILFIQKRPRGMFALKGRAVES
ncbi:MAG TPA: urea ABC transporter permease subunit UrtB [Rhodospirillaceae bacterium]|jgi:urea transport system permease protein|nr:urea ABC transporter permease subunit UrtB [Rhodospirillaceae bacterium]MAX62199.1 urea ABC transporter permease subunit UrtB [Rhodospirillaceae bacterium]HAE01158.1 urea ABC transporter permease subunit UrtB [Rhodospirillaceae bacterium]|tara:strand:- start:51160 stop:52782 length:1623 start_codon:yes stop_codon:yes gene_type:complete